MPRAREGHLTLEDYCTTGGSAIETIAMAGELALSFANERRLGIARRALESGRPRRLLIGARALTVAGVALRAGARRGPQALDHLPSALFLAAALTYRLGWIAAGRPSALDHEAVAAVARSPDGAPPRRASIADAPDVAA